MHDGLLTVGADRADLRIAAAGPATSIAAGLISGGPAWLGVGDGDLAAIVVSDGTITGTVTVTHLRQIVRRETLRAQPGPVTGPAAHVPGQGVARPWPSRLRRPHHEPGTGG